MKDIKSEFDLIKHLLLDTPTISLVTPFLSFILRQFLPKYRLFRLLGNSFQSFTLSQINLYSFIGNRKFSLIEINLLADISLKLHSAWSAKKNKLQLSIYYYFHNISSNLFTTDKIILIYKFVSVF